jgi:hypothetical protein
MKFSEEQIKRLNDAINNYIDCTEDTIDFTDIFKILDEQIKIPDYEKGFNLLMKYWDSIPDERKEDLHNELRELGL